MVFELNYKSGKPVYLQLVDQVKASIASGAARAGDPLPSIRPLAEELRVNRNTIAKAYTELESQGVIETLAGKDADTARARYRKIYARFRSAPVGLALEGARLLHQHGRDFQFVVQTSGATA